MFHVTGMQASMNGADLHRRTIVLMPRWDRDAAAACIERYRVTGLALITAMVIDFLAQPEARATTTCRACGASAAAARRCPKAVARRLEQKLGLKYVEGYGMSETMAATHANPPERPKQQCLGIPIFDVDSRIVDPATLQEAAAGRDRRDHHARAAGDAAATGSSPRPPPRPSSRSTASGSSAPATSAYVDEEGYFFIIDRLKRMINASGFKVWPAEVEAMLYQHPAIQEACVIAARDAHRGETVKAVVVLKPAARGPGHRAADHRLGARATWPPTRCRASCSSSTALPKSGTGKVMWRRCRRRSTPNRPEAAEFAEYCRPGLIAPGLVR